MEFTCENPEPISMMDWCAEVPDEDCIPRNRAVKLKYPNGTTVCFDVFNLHSFFLAQKARKLYKYTHPILRSPLTQEEINEYKRIVAQFPELIERSRRVLKVYDILTHSAYFTTLVNLILVNIYNPQILDSKSYYDMMAFLTIYSILFGIAVFLNSKRLRKKLLYLFIFASIINTIKILSYPSDYQEIFHIFDLLFAASAEFLVGYRLGGPFSRRLFGRLPIENDEDLEGIEDLEGGQNLIMQKQQVDLAKKIYKEIITYLESTNLLKLNEF